MQTPRELARELTNMVADVCSQKACWNDNQQLTAHRYAMIISEIDQYLHAKREEAMLAEIDARRRIEAGLKTQKGGMDEKDY